MSDSHEQLHVQAAAVERCPQGSRRSMTQAPSFSDEQELYRHVVGRMGCRSVGFVQVLANMARTSHRHVYMYIMRGVTSWHDGAIAS